MRPFIDEKSTIQLIISLVISKLDYCNCLFYNMSKENFQKLQTVQNHCARLFKSLNDESFPSYLKDLITIYSPSRTLRSSDKFLLFKPVKKLATFGEKSFNFAAPDVWNSLPFEIRSCTVFPTFKTKLKTFFFRKAFDC